MAFALQNFYRFDDVAMFDRAPDGRLLRLGPAAGKRGEEIAGFFAERDGEEAAVLRRGSRVALQIGDRSWDLIDPDVRLVYAHRDGGRTEFEVWRGGARDYGVTYPSWWVDAPELLDPITGGPNDEDEDFLAYVFAIWRSEVIEESLAKGWIDSNAPAV